jgi:hypothetical protein
MRMIIVNTIVEPTMRYQSVENSEYFPAITGMPNIYKLRCMFISNMITAVFMYSTTKIFIMIEIKAAVLVCGDSNLDM